MSTMWSMSYRYKLMGSEREEKTEGMGSLYRTMSCYLLLVYVVPIAFFAERYSVIRAVELETTQELRGQCPFERCEFG